MAGKADVVIIGGGVAGCSVAYYLAREGVTSLVIERDGVGSQASGVAAGMLAPLAEATAPGPAFDLAYRSLRLHPEQAQRLREETGVDVLYAERPVLRLAFTEEEERELLDKLAWQQRLEPARTSKACLDVSWVRDDDLPRVEPLLGPGVRGAILSARESQIDAYRLVVALAEAASRRGVTIRNGVVVGVRRDGDRMTGVVLATGEVVEGGTYLFAMGPWASHCGEWLGLPVPVEPLRGQLVKLAAGPEITPRHVLFHRGNYVMAKVDGSVLAGTTEERVGFECRVTEDGKASIAATIRRLAPVLEGAQVVEYRAGLRPISADGLPLLGIVSGWRNVYMAAGYGRKGILLSAATGQALAELIAHGRSSVPLEPFAPCRFLAVGKGGSKS
ncbi:MAG: FAD-dependent oxidoreductase [Dehalococcoidia bacterium]|nr:FAD-dependent oxidoreductase [Dehalococcoidia bacterium]